ncbi:MAG TPA: ankyrin repeat domain-containing protein [Burkholderiaceae bacterium]|nr:ankyrin repeat domain-containing protein [Burkholderiaceae bacterium]
MANSSRGFYGLTQFSSLAFLIRWQRLLAALLVLSFSLFGTRVFAESEAFWLAIANDRVDLVRDELALGADPNAVNSNGQPAIMQAVRDDAWQVFDLLLSHRNIDVNLPNKTDETPLMYVAIVGDIPRAKALIEHGAEINRLGWSPLHYAASKGQLDMVQFLIANDALVNAPSPDGTSPLMMAAYDGSERTVRALVAAGADATAVNIRGEDAALWARRKDHESLARKLDDLAHRVATAREAGRDGAVAWTEGDAAQASAAADSGSIAGSDTSDASESSTSRYFDLDRFERDDQAF